MTKFQSVKLNDSRTLCTALYIKCQAKDDLCINTKKEVTQVTFELGLITSRCLESGLQITAKVNYLALAFTISYFTALTHVPLGSVLVYRFTRAATKDQTIHNT